VAQRVYIGIGSNLGDRRANSVDAARRIRALPGTTIVRSSSHYESEPHGDSETWFVNSVLELDTALAPEPLLSALLGIEEAMGRTRVTGQRWEARIIDLDILLYDQEVVATPGLTIPHPEIPKRRFVLMPLAELAPELIHPQLGRTVSTLLATVQDPKRVTPLPPLALPASRPQ